MAVNVVRKVDDWVAVKNVIASVSNKTGLDRLVPRLVEIVPEVHFYSTGGTHSEIARILGPEMSARHLTQVSDYTGQPETQGGLVKTLDFKIYLGLLTERYNEAHRADLARTRAIPIDLTVANLYPFRETIARPGTTPEEARANIDIGGPCMVRASAKNYLRVAPLVDPADYDSVLDILARNGGRLDLATRYDLARKAFAHTADYDRAISGYMAQTDAAKVVACYDLDKR